MSAGKKLHTLTKGELFKLIESYPDNTEIEITVLQSDIDGCQPAALNANDKVYAFGVPGDHTYDQKTDTLLLSVWSETK